MMAVQAFEVILGLMLLALVGEMAARRLRVPPSAVLVLGGAAVALTPGLPVFELDPELILYLFLPPLLFSSAYFTAWRDFRANLRIILQLAVGAVAFTTLVVGVVAHFVLPGLPWAACFAFGAIVSPPAAVAAKAVLKGLPMPRRLVTLLEGESLVNDASGLVLFRVAVAAAATGSVELGAAAGQFVLVATGGVVAGLVVGYALVAVLRRVTVAELNIVGGLLGAWGAYAAGELLHVSGVLCVVTSGLIVGSRQHEILRAGTRTEANAVWNITVFLLESLIFILIGLSLRGVHERLEFLHLPLSDLLWPTAALTAAMVLARFAWIVPTTYLSRFLLPSLRRRDPYPPLAVPLVMGWAGMRGVVSLAVALSLPIDFPGRDMLLPITLAVVLVSILLQGTTLGPLIRSLHLRGFALDAPSVLDEAAARAHLAEAALAQIRSATIEADGTQRHPRLLEQFAHRAAMATRLAERAEDHLPHRRLHFSLVLAANQAARDDLLGLHRDARVDDEVLRLLEAELDLEELGVRQALGTDEPD